MAPLVRPRLTRGPATCIAAHRCWSPSTVAASRRTPPSSPRLPGIGRSTAAAIAAFAFGRHGAILDSNVKRVLTRVFGIEGFPGKAGRGRELWALAESLLPPTTSRPTRRASWTWEQRFARSPARLRHRPMRGLCVAERDGRQAALPTARPAKVVPAQGRHTIACFAMVEHILLERRSPQGIWGGLLALPEGEPKPSPHALALTCCGRPCRRCSMPFTFPADAADDPLRRCVLTLFARKETLSGCRCVRAIHAGLPAPMKKLFCPTSPRGSR